MLFGKSRSELKVGIFVFFGLVILTVFILQIGDIGTWKGGYNIKFQFNFVNGVKVGAPVRFAGVDIGQVRDINIVFSPKEKKTEVLISARIKKDVKIPADSTVWVNTLGLLGEKYIEIMPPEKYGRFVKPEETLIGIDPIAMHEVAQLAKDIADEINDSMRRIKGREGTIGKLLYDDSLYKELEALVADLRKNPWKLFKKTRERN